MMHQSTLNLAMVVTKCVCSLVGRMPTCEHMVLHLVPGSKAVPAMPDYSDAGWV